MNHILITTAALSLMITTPVLAQQLTSKSTSGSLSEAVVIGGTTIFEGSRIPNNTPNTYTNATSGTTKCTNPGIGIGFGGPGLGLNFAIPLGADNDCWHEQMAAFKMRTAELLMKSGKEEMALRAIVDADESLCRISYNMGTKMCVLKSQPITTAVYHYCHSPAGYYPVIMTCSHQWQIVNAAR